MSAVFDLSCLSRTSVPESKLSHDRPSQPRFCRQNADLIRGKNLALRAKKHMSYCIHSPFVCRLLRTRMENVFFVFSTASAESWNKTVVGFRPA